MGEQEDENFIKFLDWAGSNKYVMLISFPRSGREWFANIASGLYGRPSSSPVRVAAGYKDYFCFMYHGAIFLERVLSVANNGKFILLVRDPRDCVLSWAYRLALGEGPEGSAEDMSTILLAGRIGEACRFWYETYEPFAKFDRLFIRYEQMCLYPDVVWERVGDFVGVKALDSVLNVYNKFDEVQNVVIDDLGILKRERYFTGFNSCVDRYKNHCLKWQRDKYFIEEFNCVMWSAMQHGGMEEFGYMKDGHNLEEWV